VEVTELSEEEQYRAMASNGEFSALAERLGKTSSLDAVAVREQLFGTWKLVGASHADVSLSGSAGKWERALGHTQTFRKPDPMDIFSGDPEALFFLTTTEVVADTKAGSSSTAKVKGRFEVVGAGDVVESYSRREVGGAVQDGARLSNSWTCVHVGDTLRVCRLADGGLRVYDRVEVAEAEAAISKLSAEPVKLDPAAALEDIVEEVEEEEVIDTRPAWQKRIDEADGIKRTANGTPIITHGPIGSTGN